MAEQYGGIRRRLGAYPYLGDADPGGGDTWKEYYVYSADFAGAQALTAGVANARPSAVAFTPFLIAIGSDANFEFIKSMYQATDPRVYVKYRDDTGGRYLNRNALDLMALAGIATTGVGAGTAAAVPFVGVAPNPLAPPHIPFIWPTTHVIAASSTFTVDAADYSGAGNTVRLSFAGAKIRPGRAPWDDPAHPVIRRIPFNLAIPDDSINPAIAANATQILAATVDQEADFLVKKITGVRTGVCTVNILDGRDRQWFSSAQHFDNVVGSAGFPNILPAQRFVPRGSTVLVTIQDLSAATNTVRLYLEGEKIYYG